MPVPEISFYFDAHGKGNGRTLYERLEKLASAIPGLHKEILESLCLFVQSRIRDDHQHEFTDRTHTLENSVNYTIRKRPNKQQWRARMFINKNPGKGTAAVNKGFYYGAWIHDYWPRKSGRKGDPFLKREMGLIRHSRQRQFMNTLFRNKIAELKKQAGL